MCMMVCAMYVNKSLVTPLLYLFCCYCAERGGDEVGYAHEAPAARVHDLWEYSRHVSDALCPFFRARLVSDLLLCFLFCVGESFVCSECFFKLKYHYMFVNLNLNIII